MNYLLNNGLLKANVWWFKIFFIFQLRFLSALVLLYNMTVWVHHYYYINLVYRHMFVMHHMLYILNPHHFDLHNIHQLYSFYLNILKGLTAEFLIQILRDAAHNRKKTMVQRLIMAPCFVPYTKQEASLHSQNAINLIIAVFYKNVR